MWNLPVCDFWLQLWRLSPAGRRPLVLLASRVPEEVVSRRCAVACPRPPFSLPRIFPPETAPGRGQRHVGCRYFVDRSGDLIVHLKALVPHEWPGKCNTKMDPPTHTCEDKVKQCGVPSLKVEWKIKQRTDQSAHWQCELSQQMVMCAFQSRVALQRGGTEGCGRA